MEFTDLLRAADNQLYEAKEGRRISKTPAFGRQHPRTDFATGGRAPHSEFA
jgi:hypothetical protein